MAGVLMRITLEFESGDRLLYEVLTDKTAVGGVVEIIRYEVDDDPEITTSKLHIMSLPEALHQINGYLYGASTEALRDELMQKPWEGPWTGHSYQVKITNQP